MALAEKQKIENQGIKSGDTIPIFFISIMLSGFLITIIEVSDHAKILKTAESVGRKISGSQVEIGGIQFNLTAK